MCIMIYVIRKKNWYHPPIVLILILILSISVIQTIVKAFFIIVETNCEYVWEIESKGSCLSIVPNKLPSMHIWTSNFYHQWTKEISDGYPNHYVFVYFTYSLEYSDITKCKTCRMWNPCDILDQNFILLKKKVYSNF